VFEKMRNTAPQVFNSVRTFCHCRRLRERRTLCSNIRLVPAAQNWRKFTQNCAAGIVIFVKEALNKCSDGMQLIS
jgi:hypothetical protein